MKNFNLVEQVLNEKSGNVLIIGGECSGKSSVIDCIVEYLVANTPLFVMTNSSDTIALINNFPDSNYVYKSKKATIPDDIISSITQDVIIIDEYPELDKLLSTIGVNKKLIMTYSAANIADIPDDVSKYFKVVVLSEMLDAKTHEKGITGVTYL